MATPKKKSPARTQSRKTNAKAKVKLASAKKVKAKPRPKAKTAMRKAAGTRGRKSISGAKVIQAFQDLQAVTGAQNTFATERGLGM